MRWAGHVAHTETWEIHTYDVLVGNTEGKRPLGRPSRRGEDNIIMDFMEMVWKGVDWMNLAQDRDQWPAFVNTVMDLRFL
jgi:hypothetical protein